jgi:hypothetical protein
MRLVRNWIALSILALALASGACKLGASTPAISPTYASVKIPSLTLAEDTATFLPAATALPTDVPTTAIYPTATDEPTPTPLPPSLTPAPTATLPFKPTLDEVTPTQPSGSGSMEMILPPPFPGHVLSAKSDLPMCDDHMLQDRLASLGYLEPGGSEWNDGTFGAQTETAVHTFEKTNGLLEDGVVDWQEWEVLFDPAVAPAGGSPASPVQPDPLRTVFPVGENPVALAYDGQRVWVAHASDVYRSGNSLLAIDPASGQVSAPILVGACPPSSEYGENTITDAIFAAGKVWVVMPGSSSYQAIDPLTGLVEPPVHYAKYPTADGSLGFDGERLWVSSLADIGLRAFNPASGELIHDLQLYGGPGAMQLAGEYLWVVNGSSVSEVIDPVNGVIVNEVMAGGLSLVYDGRWLWFADGIWVTAIDTTAQDPFASESTYKIITAGSSPVTLAFDGTRIWVADAVDNNIQPIQVATGEFGASLPVGDSPSALLFDGARLWVANRGEATVQFIIP